MFLAKEAPSAGPAVQRGAEESDGGEVREAKKVEEDETIHTLPTIAIPSCGTRDTCCTRRGFKR